MQTFALKGRHAWRVLGGTARSQAAEMVIAPGDAEGGPNNRHRRSDQWLFVIAGKAIATVEGRKKHLVPGMLLLIEKGERHAIRAFGRKPFKTVNIYTPPAYR